MSKALFREATDMLNRGRAYVKMKAPFSSDVANGLVRRFFKRKNPTDPPIAVSKSLVLIVDPLWVVEEEPTFKGSTGDSYIGGCLFHEICHVQRDMRRIEALRNPLLGNIAADEAINCTLRKAGWNLPPWVIYPEAFKHPEFQTLEWYFEELKKLSEPAIFKALNGYGFGKGKCGGVAGNPSPDEVEADQEDGRTPVDVERIRYNTAIKAKQAENKGYGDATVFLHEKIDFERRDPVVPWPQRLSRIIRRATGSLTSGGDDLSYMRPSKRAMALGTLRPGPISHQVVPLIFRDTSGSMGAEELNHANNQTIDIMKQLGLDEVWIGDGDTQIHGELRRVKITDIPRLEVFGRGGTNFVNVLGELEKRLKRMRNKPDFIVCQTDGDGPAPKIPPRGLPPIIWCVVPSSYMRRPAYWGELIVCSNNPEVLNSLDDPY